MEHDKTTTKTTVETAPAFFKIFVTDLDRSVEFYAECLGFRETRQMDTGKLEEVVLAPAKEGAGIVICRWKDGRETHLGDAQGPTGYFVSDVDGISRKMIERGAKAVIGPVDYSGLRIAVLADPDGHQIELLQRPAA